MLKLSFFLFIFAFGFAVDESKAKPKLIVPKIDQIKIMSRLKANQTQIITEKKLIHKIYRCIPFQNPTSLGHTLDYNEPFVFEFYQNKKLIYKVSVFYDLSAWRPLNNSSNIPFKVIGDLSKVVKLH